MKDMLYAAVQLEVDYRHGRFCYDTNLKEAIESVASWLVEPERQGLLIMGTLGNGKTTIVRAMENIINAFKVYDPISEMVVRLRCLSALDITHMARNDYEAYKKLCATPMLAIDDYGTEPAEVMDYGNLLRPMDELLYTRYTNQLFTIVTTNLTNEQLRERTADRLYDRFREMFKVVLFTNPSYRK